MHEYTKEDLKELLRKDYFDEHTGKWAFQAGRRNDDAVDFSIVCHCLGLDPMAEFDKLCAAHGIVGDDYDLAKEHMERVQPYLDRWGEPGTMDAMVYSIVY